MKVVRGKKAFSVEQQKNSHVLVYIKGYKLLKEKLVHFYCQVNQQYQSQEEWYNKISVEEVDRLW